MALPTLVQSNSNQSSGAATTFAVAFTVNVTAGNTLVAFAGCASAAHNVTFSDSLNGAWGAVTASSNTLDSCAMHIFPNTAGGACTVTATYDASVGGRLAIMEFSGLLTANLVDQTAINHTASVTSLVVGPSPATTNPIDVVVAGYVTNNSGNQWTPGNGYSTINMPATGPFWVQYLVTASAGTQTSFASVASNTQFDGALAALRAPVTGDTLLGQGWV